MRIEASHTSSTNAEAVEAKAAMALLLERNAKLREALEMAINAIDLGSTVGARAILAMAMEGGKKDE